MHFEFLVQRTKYDECCARRPMAVAPVLLVYGGITKPTTVEPNVLSTTLPPSSRMYVLACTGCMLVYCSQNELLSPYYKLGEESLVRFHL